MKSSKLTPVVRIVDDDEKVLASEAFLEYGRLPDLYLQQR